MMSRLVCVLVAASMALPPANAVGIIVGGPMAPHASLPAARPQPIRLPVPAILAPFFGEGAPKTDVKPPVSNKPAPVKQGLAPKEEGSTVVPVQSDVKRHRVSTKSTNRTVAKVKSRRNSGVSRADQHSVAAAAGIVPSSSEKPESVGQLNELIKQQPSNVGESESTRRSVSAMQLQSEHVSVEITDHLAKTKIAEIFKNNGNHAVAGTYLFPLPKDAAFSSFTLHIDGVPVKGELLGSSEARRQYESIVRLMVDPGLLEYVDSRTVRARIFPIPAHGTRKIELEYTQLLTAENGFTRYEFPLKAENGSAPIADVQLKVRLNSKEALRTVWSPSHKVLTRAVNSHSKEITFEAKDLHSAHNFALVYSASDAGMTGDIAFYPSQSDDGYFLLSLSPNFQSEPMAKDILLIADTSGSMQGEKIQQLKAALKHIVGAVSDADRLNIISFNTKVFSFKNELVSATKSARTEAKQFIDSMQAVGGTNIERALATGAQMISADSQRPLYLLFITDGLPTVGTSDIEKLVDMIPPAKCVRVFDVGIGNDVNTRLLDGLAERHHGKSQYVNASDNLEVALAEVYRGIQQPVLTDMKIAFEGIEAKEVYPPDLSDIFVGDQSILLGRFKKAASGKIVVSGQINGHRKTFSFPFTYAPNSQQIYSELPRLWATRRIGALSREIEKLADVDDNIKAGEMEKEVFAVSKKFGLISPYASYLVKEPETRLGAARDAVTIGRQTLDAGLESIRRAKLLVSYSSATQVGQAADQGSRVVGDKIFKLSNNGVWVDVDFDARSFPNPERIVMGSDRYMELSADAELAKCLSLGRQLIVVWKGRCFQIVATDHSLLESTLPHLQL